MKELRNMIIIICAIFVIASFKNLDKLLNNVQTCINGITANNNTLLIVVVIGVLVWMVMRKKPRGRDKA